MKIFLILIVLCLAQKGLAGIVVQHAVVSQQELREKGVQIRKVAEGGIINSYTVDIVIDFKKEAGAYQKCGLIVADSQVSSENLKTGDIYAKVEKARRTAYTMEKVFSFILIEALTGFDRMPI